MKLAVKVAGGIAILGMLAMGSTVFAKSMTDVFSAQVANVAASLKALEKDWAIGKDIKESLSKLASSTHAATTALEKIEARGKVKTFLVGSDYKNIGEVRSKMMTIQNEINRLTRAMDRASSTAVKTQLKTQIDALKAAQAQLEAFIKSKEGQFSLFGWMFKGRATSTASSTAASTTAQ